MAALVSLTQLLEPQYSGGECLQDQPPLPSLMLADSAGLQLLSWTLLTSAPASIPRYLSSAWALWDTLHMNFLQFESKHTGWLPSYFLPACKVFLQELRFGTWNFHYQHLLSLEFILWGSLGLTAFSAVCLLSSAFQIQLSTSVEVAFLPLSAYKVGDWGCAA